MFDEIISHIPSYPPPPSLFFACFIHVSLLAVTSMVSILKMSLICKATAGSHSRKKERKHVIKKENYVNFIHKEHGVHQSGSVENRNSTHHLHHQKHGVIKRGGESFLRMKMLAYCF